MRGDRVMAEGGKRIDLGTPLRSVRGADALPYHKADLKFGPVRHPGAVPFVWEQSPGRPKSVRTRRPPPPSPASSQPGPSENGGEAGIDASPYHDALGERDREALRGVAADGPRTGAAGRKVDRAEVEATKEAKTPEVVYVAAVLRKEEKDGGDDEDERFSDALDTLSRTESFTVNCSVSGLSGMPGRPTGGAAAGAEPGARGFMMDRFIPAAQAVAVGSPQYTFRKPGTAGATGNSGREHARAAAANARTGNDDDRARRTPVQLPYQHLPPNYLSCNYPRREEHGEEEEEEEDDDDYDVHSTRGFASKGCGLLPGLCVKSSLLLLNPVPKMKRGGRGRDRGLPSQGRGQKATSPLARSSHNQHLGFDSNGQSWEEVYKHKLEQKYIHQGEDRSKLTTESNHLTFWSDSQTGDGSSPVHHSIGGASPYRRDVVMSPSTKANGSFGIEDQEEKMSRSNGSTSLGRDHDRGSLVGSDQSSLKGSSSMSSGLDRTVHGDSMDHRGDIDSETSHLALLLDSKTSLNSTYDTQLGGRLIVRRNTIGEDQDNDPSTGKIAEVTEPALLMPSRHPASVKLDDRKTFTHDTSQDVPLHSEDNSVVKKEIMPLQYLLPLPVPKSPSESWLSRNLPSVTNKPPLPSFLGIQVQPKKQAPWASMHPKENDLKPSRPRQIRFGF